MPSVSSNRAKVFSFEEFISEPDQCDLTVNRAMRYLEYICSAGKIHQPRCAFVEITDMLPSPSIAVSSEIFYKNEETLCKYFGVVYLCRRRLGK